MVPKSEIVQPKPGAVLGVGTNRLFGIAWAGEHAVARVDISTDGGESWNHAELVGPRAAYSWTMWEYLWEVVKPGEHLLLARTTAEDGQVQPHEHDPLLGGYMINVSRPISVRVDDKRRSRAKWSDLDTLCYDMNAYAEEQSRLPLDIELEFAGGEGI
jgi:hypothetical protein